jgi:hypothetical protein
VVEERAGPDDGGRVDVDLKLLADLGLQVIRDRNPARPPQRVRYPLRLQRVEALEVTEAVNKPRARRVPLHHREHTYLAMSVLAA